MYMELFRLFGSFFIDGGKEAEQQLDNIDKKAGGVGSKLGSMIGTAAKWGAAIGAGALAAGTSLFATATKAAAATDRVDKLSQKIGISRQSFQEWDFILSQNGASVEGLQMGLKTLSRAADEAAQGTATYADIFDRLNVSVVDANGNLKDQETLFNETILALSEMENATERTALASQLLGRSAQELAPMLNSGAESVENLRKMAHDLGLVLSDEAVDAGVLFTDTMDQLKRSFGAAFTTIGTMVMPMMQSFSEWIIENMPMIQEIFSTVFNVISTAVGYVVDTVMPSLMGIFQTAYEVITTIWKKWGSEIEGTTTGLFDVIKNTVQNALAIVEGLIKVFGGIMTGDFEMIKEGVMKIWNSLWDWIKNTGKFIRDIGKNIVTALWDGIKDMWSKMTSWVSDKVKSLLKSLNPFKGSSVTVSGPSIPAMATGGTVLRPGMALVGEAGPELLELPQGAKVKPLTGESIDYDRLEAIAYASFYDAFVDAMKTLGKGELRINIDGRTLAREMVPRIIAENQRMGVVTT